MNNFVNKYDEKRAISGIGGALYFKKPTDSHYMFAFPCESIPSVRGDVETFEFSVITSEFKGQTEGQMSLDKKDIPVLWHRDMIARLEELAEMGELDFLAISPDWSADKFTATLTFKRDDMANDTLKGTVTIIPSAADDDHILDCRNMLIPTVKFISTVPDTIKLDATETPKTKTVKVTDGASVTCKVIDGATREVSTKATASWANGVLTITNANKGTGATTEYLVIELVAAKTNYQSWRSTITLTVPAVSDTSDQD